MTGGVLQLRRVGEVRAVDHVTFPSIGRGETVGLVGESGCGKTTVGRAIVNILSAMVRRRGERDRSSITTRAARSIWRR